MFGLVQLQPALILEHRPYRESSLLLEVFTRDFGILPVLAKGVRKEKSKTAGLLLPFTLLNISFLDKNELKVLTQTEYAGSYRLQRLALYCGFYINELLQKFLHKHDPHPDLFERYQSCLLELSEADVVEQCLRYFELDLLQETGYGAELAWDCATETAVLPQLRYNFSPGLGMVAAADGVVSGLTLNLLAMKAPLNGSALAEAKQLSRKMLDSSLQGKALKSREVLAKIIKYL